MLVVGLSGRGFSRAGGFPSPDLLTLSSICGREVPRKRLAHDRRAADSVDGDPKPHVATAAAEVGGVDEDGACGI